MPVQTTVITQAQLAVAGQIDSPAPHIITRMPAAALTVGLVACFASAADTVRHLERPASDADAFIATIASSASPQTISGAGLDGAVGDDIMRHARNVTLTLSNHADWDATTAIVYGLDENGAPCSESLSIPNGGNATVSGLVLFSAVTSLVIPAQSGTGGTATLGFGDVLGPLDGSVAGVVPFDVSRTGLTYATTEAAPLVRKGRVWMSSETSALQGRDVYVRMVAGGGESLGAVRATPDSNDCAILRGARFASSTAAAGLVLVELNLP